MRRPREINWAIGIGVFCVAAVALYWTAWFAAPEFIQARQPGAPDYALYVNFEQAFLLADGWLATAALIGVFGLKRMRDWGWLFMLLAGSSAIFLGLMDTLYAIQQGVFSSFSPEAAQTFIICATCLILGPITIIYLWSKREHLL